MRYSCKKYLRLRVFLILKCFSVISFLIISAGCKNQKQKLKSAVQNTNNEFLKNSDLYKDTMQTTNIPNPTDTIIPVYDPPVEVICDYGVIPVVEPPQIDATLYGVEPDFYEENEPQD